MRVALLGSDNIMDYDIVNLAISASGLEKLIEVAICGDTQKMVNGQLGAAEYLSELWARVHKRDVICVQTEDKYGNHKFDIRNIKMIKEHKPDALIAIWDGLCPKTLHAINIAKRYELKVFNFIYTI